MLQARVSKVLIAAFLLSHVLLLATAENILDDDEAYVANEQVSLYFNSEFSCLF